MDNQFSIFKRIVVAATPAQVWRAVSTAEGQAAWSPDPGAVEQEGMAVEREELHRLHVRTPEAPDGAHHQFEYRISSDDHQTVLEFTHSGNLGADWEGDYDYAEVTGHGWDMYLHTLDQYLTHFVDQPASYVEAVAPAHANSAEAWQRLLHALGLTAPTAVGDRVVLRPEGLPEIAGEVDYAVPGEDFLAVRGADGLYRFHSLERIGMPIAVGHYIYGREAAAEPWRAWLERVFA